ncbi:hypothetical protein, partial [Pseudomonas kitaguniensis]|uniref:hypothetical protein n=2 Tax=Pseudomonadota TaxID=1224 RepID=UPI003D05EB1C
TPAMLRESLMDRVEQLDQSSEAAEWLEAVGAPDNTYEQDPHERFPLEDWQQEVANGDTLVGYDEWLNTQVEMASVTDDAEDD